MDSFGTASDYSPLFSQGAVIAPTFLHPVSRGTVSIDARGEPVIEHEYYSEPDDMRRMVRCVRLAQEVMAGGAMAELEPELLTHKVLEEELGRDTDEYWEEYIRLFGFLVYHPVGTCSMGGGEEGVVDAQLRVRGIRGLRVCDASVMPEITSGNTNVPTGAVAHNCVAMVKEAQE